MSSISMSSGEGSIKLRRRPESMRCHVLGACALRWPRGVTNCVFTGEVLCNCLNFPTEIIPYSFGSCLPQMGWTPAAPRGDGSHVSIERSVMVTSTSDYLKPISFMIVDNQAYMRRVIKNILETLGCKNMDEARSGGEALSNMRSWAPDIVLTEALLAPMSGVELLRAVRADKGPLKFTPVIMITAETRREKVILARKAGLTQDQIDKLVAGDSIRDR
ncbi:MAG: response regulator [Rhodospirillaceae bacterium]|nr:response regulator [Rhodospirillaceae bacterium]